MYKYTIQNTMCFSVIGGFAFSLIVPSLVCTVCNNLHIKMLNKNVQSRNNGILLLFMFFIMTYYFSCYTHVTNVRRH